tara:strand:+ start:146 stop:1186 length:1041 start_codon:yes stop_codon:yes gene_type:complete
MGIKLYHKGQWVEFGGNLSNSAAGTNKQVQFNDNGLLAGANQLEFDKGDSSSGSPPANLTLKPNYSGSSESGTYGGGSIITQSNNASDNYPYNRAQMHADGGLELMRRRTASPGGGPYLDFKAQVVSGSEEDFDSRIQMDYAASGSGIDPTNNGYSAITFLTGGGGYYHPIDNANGRVTEKLRIQKNGDIVIGVSTTQDTIPKDPVIKGGGIYCRTKVITSTGFTQTPFFTISATHGAMCGTAYITCSNNSNSQTLVYNFALQYYVGGDIGQNILAADGSGYPQNTNANSMSMVWGSNGSSTNTMYVNTQGPNFVKPADSYGTPGTLVTVMMILGASNEALTVTRP